MELTHHPEPLVRARPAASDEMPRTATSLVKKAEALGWWTSSSYAHGTTIDAQGRPSRLVESVVVRLANGAAGARAVGVWMDGKFSTGFVWAHWSELRMVGARDVSAWVTSVSEMAAT